MLKIFQISFVNNREFDLKSKYIQYHILKKFEKKSYFKPYRINVIFQLVNQSEKLDFWYPEAKDKLVNIHSKIAINSEDDFEEVVVKRVFSLLDEYFKASGWDIPAQELDPTTFLHEDMKRHYAYMPKKWNADKSLYCQVEMDFKEDYTEFFCNFFSKSKQLLAEISIMKFYYNVFMFRILFANVFWEKDYFCLEDCNKEIKMVINPKNNFVETFFTPKFNNQELLEQFVASMDYRYDNDAGIEVFDLWRKNMHSHNGHQ